MLFDTNFFVDLDRERRRGQEGPAHRFLEKHAGDEMAMSIITCGELGRGFRYQEAWREFCNDFLLLQLDHETLWIASEIFNNLRRTGMLISDNDLWIAATAIRHDLILATENTRHFERIPGLRQCGYK